jgi:putative hemolysin
MKKLVLVVAVLLLVAGCSTNGSNVRLPPLNPAGLYVGTMTATFGGSGTTNITAKVEAGSKSGYTAELTSSTGSTTAFCSDLDGARLECWAIDGGLNTFEWNGDLTRTTWKGTFALYEYSAGGAVTLAGTFNLSRQ